MTNRSKRLAVWLLLGAMAAAQTGCSSVLADRQAKPELLKPVKKQEDFHVVKSGSIIQQLQGIGVFVPTTTKFHQYAVGGKVKTVYVEPGDTVRAGDVLLELDPSDLLTKILDQRLVVAKAEDELETVKLKYDPELLKLAVLSQQVEQMKLDALEESLAKRKLIAERSGVVTFVDFIKPGDSVPAYKDLIGISDPKDLQFMFTGNRNNDLFMIEKDMPVQVTFNGAVFTGKVAQAPRSAPTTSSIIQSDRNTRSLLITLDRNPPDAVMGSQGELTIVTGSKENVVVIPRIGLRSYQGRSYVHVRDGESRKEVDVEKGIETATEVEIRKGLQQGQEIILNN